MFKNPLTLALAFLLLVGLSTQSFAITNADIFSYDEAMIDSKFQAVENLEEILMANPEADLNQVKLNNPEAVAEFNNQNNNVTPMLPGSPLAADEPALGISGYIWGACLGWVGILVVYLVLDDASDVFRKAEVKKAVIGCVISTAVWAVLYFTVLGSALGFASGI